MVMTSRTLPSEGAAAVVMNTSWRPVPYVGRKFSEATEKSDGQEALLCEGTCQKRLHRWCAGVHKENYEALASSDKPFFCPSCCLAEHRQLIVTLVDTVETLKDEIRKLKEAKAPSSPTVEKSDLPNSSEDDQPWKKFTGKRKPGRNEDTGSKGGNVRANGCESPIKTIMNHRGWILKLWNDSNNTRQFLPQLKTLGLQLKQLPQ